MRSTSAPVIIELPGVSELPRLREGERVLLTAPGATLDRAVLARALSWLNENPSVAAVIELPAQDDASSLLLDLLLRPQDVSSVLVRGEALSQCDPPPALGGTLARAQLAVRLACGLEVARCGSAIAPSSSPGCPEPDDTSHVTRETLRAFALEDLYPVLRTPEGVGRIYASILECASKLLERGRRPEGFALGAWAEALVEGRERGLGLGLDLPRPADATENPHRESSGDPLVSLIVPTFNRPQLLARALASVAAQTWGDLEVIVVNDGGVDPGAILDPFQHTIGPGGALTVVHHAKNCGLAAARNSGLRRARGRYVGFLDDDDRLLPHHLAALLPRLKLGARVVHGDVRSVLEVPAHPLPCTKSLAVHYQFDYDPATFPIENSFPVHSLLCERELLVESGGFDETLPVLEDWDLWLRVFQVAAPIRVRRVTSEVRQRSDGSNMTAQNRGCWSDVCAQIYGKTLELELRDPLLRRRRLAYLLKLAEEGRHPFPHGAGTWLQGDDGLWPIHPEGLEATP